MKLLDALRRKILRLNNGVDYRVTDHPDGISIQRGGSFPVLTFHGDAAAPFMEGYRDCVGGKCRLENPYLLDPIRSTFWSQGYDARNDYHTVGRL